MTSVFVYPGDQGGCGHYRLIFPAQAVGALTDHDIIIGGEGDDDFNMWVTIRQLPDGRQVRHVDWMDPKDMPDVDTIVMQRPLGDTTWQFMREFRKRGIRVVCDLDDDFWHLHPSNPLVDKIKQQKGRVHPSFIKLALENVDAVTVSTPALADMYGRCTDAPVHVIPNFVPARYLEIRHETNQTVGWSGNLLTHGSDVQTMRGAFGRLQRDGRHIHIVGMTGNRPGLTWESALSVRTDELFSATGPVHFDDWPTELAEVGVAAVPLELNTFNEGKSWLKGLEFASVGVPFVASPTGPYREMAALGFGSVVENPRKWVQALRRVDPGSGQRDRVRRLGFTYEDQYKQWERVWCPTG